MAAHSTLPMALTRLMAAHSTIPMALARLLAAHANQDSLAVYAESLHLTEQKIDFFLLLAAAHAVAQGVPPACAAYDVRAASVRVAGMLKMLSALIRQICTRLRAFLRQLERGRAPQLPGLGHVADACADLLVKLATPAAQEFFIAEVHLPSVGSGDLKRDLEALLARLQTALECVARSRARRSG
jgi:hypothetical protein